VIGSNWMKARLPMLGNATFSPKNEPRAIPLASATKT
jgi:hypothetical protein